MEVGTRKKLYIWTRTGWINVPVKILYLVKEPRIELGCMNEVNGNDYRCSSSLKQGFSSIQYKWV